MKRFTFRLEPLYEYRQRLEDICKKEFGEALKRLEEEELKLDFLREEHKKSSEECDRMKEEGAQSADITPYFDYLLGLKLHMDEQRKVINTVKNALEAKRAELVKASQDKKVMEKMKERSYTAYNEALNKEEQKLTDELASRLKKGALDEA